MLFDRSALAPTPAVIGRVVTATITLICVLIVYDGWANLELKDALLIAIGPVLAIFVSHVFASTLVQHVELGRRPTRREWSTTVARETRFLLLAIPPVAIMVVLNAFGVALNEAVRVVIWLEAGSLGLWAGVAAYYAGFRGRTLAFSILMGLLMAVLVLGIEVLIEPGQQSPQTMTPITGDGF